MTLLGLFLIALGVAWFVVRWAEGYGNVDVDNGDGCDDGDDAAARSEPVYDKATVKAAKKALGKVEVNRTAAHEAGHAVVAMRCSHVHAVTHVRVTTEHSGVCGIQFMNVGPIFAAEMISCQIVWGLGGAAGEAQAVGAFRSAGAEQDFMQAVRDAKKLVAMGSKFAFRPNKRRDIPFHQVFSEPQPRGVIEIISDAYDVARDLVERHHVEHAKLTGLLLHRREVKEHDLKMIFGDRRAAHKFARLGAPRFL